jgi:YD repeat-containing protein
MKKKLHVTIKLVFAVIMLVLVVINILLVNPLSSAQALQIPTPEITATGDYLESTVLDGNGISSIVINGPPHPPAGFEIERRQVSFSSIRSSSTSALLTVPAFSWLYGCAAVSGAMIAGYYDRNGYPNMYSGPTNGGVMPIDNSSWPSWSDGSVTYPSNPLVASRNGVDGWEGHGSIDDSWVSYLSSAADPYITNSWTQHTFNSAIGDYMWTSQSAFGNVDGSTRFWNYNDYNGQLSCNILESNLWADGTLGRKHFYEARGYTVTDCYNQKTDNTVAGGFSYAQFMAEIDAGRPVLLNLAGHSIVGVGYDASTNLVYIHDTWDYSTHSMTWGGSYSGMLLQSVSIVNLASNEPTATPVTPSPTPVTPSPTPVTPTNTFTPVPPTATNTFTPVPPTATKTATMTATRTPTKVVIKTATRTPTKVVIKTATRTPTKVVIKTATRTPTKVVIKTATRTPTKVVIKTATKTATPATVINLLKDPGFELYPNNVSWGQTSTNSGTPLCNIADCGSFASAKPRTGQAWAWFGGVTTPSEIATLSQSVIIPRGTAKLDFYFWLGNAAAGSDAKDVFTVTVDGKTVWSANATQLATYNAYKLITIDLGAYANGLSHKISFNCSITGQNVTFNLDDVKLHK